MQGRKTKQNREKSRQEFQVIRWPGTTHKFMERMKYFSYNKAACSALVRELLKEIDDEKQ